MKRPVLALTLAVLTMAATALAQAPMTTLFITPTDDGFETYLTAHICHARQ